MDAGLDLTMLAFAALPALGRQACPRQAPAGRKPVKRKAAQPLDLLAAAARA